MYIIYTYMQSQLSQPFLMGEMLQSLNLMALHWTLLYVLVSPVLGSPERDAALQVWPHQWLVEGKDPPLTCWQCFV